MSRRRLDPEERAIWKHVTRSIAPLGKRRRDDDAEEAISLSPPKAKPPIKARPAVVAPPSPARAAHRPEPAPLGRKEKRRLARDNDSIHGRLDLHGLTQAEAHDALYGFLHRSQTKGAKIVLVITGKGVRGDSARGVLKRQVPMWLRLPEFSEMVVGFEAAAITHGGEGAIYVRLRRVR